MDSLHTISFSNLMFSCMPGAAATNGIDEVYKKS